MDYSWWLLVLAITMLLYELWLKRCRIYVLTLVMVSFPVAPAHPPGGQVST